MGILKSICAAGFYRKEVRLVNSFRIEINGAPDGSVNWQIYAGTQYGEKSGDVEDAYNINNVIKKLDVFTRQLATEATA